jgi:hypothetical protein
MALTGRREIHVKFLWGNLEGRRHLEGIAVNERIILKFIVKLCNGKA